MKNPYRSNAITLALVSKEKKLRRILLPSNGGKGIKLKAISQKLTSDNSRSTDHGINLYSTNKSKLRTKFVKTPATLTKKSPFESSLYKFMGTGFAQPNNTGDPMM